MHSIDQYIARLGSERGGSFRRAVTLYHLDELCLGELIVSGAYRLQFAKDLEHLLGGLWLSEYLDDVLMHP